MIIKCLDGFKMVVFGVILLHFLILWGILPITCQKLVKIHSVLKKTYKYYNIHNPIMEGMVMRESGSVGMISFVMGIGGELGKRPAREAPVSLEILSVGPQFRELDYREYVGTSF